MAKRRPAFRARDRLRGHVRREHLLRAPIIEREGGRHDETPRSREIGRCRRRLGRVDRRGSRGGEPAALRAHGEVGRPGREQGNMAVRTERLEAGSGQHRRRGAGGPQGQRGSRGGGRRGRRFDGRCEEGTPANEPSAGLVDERRTRPGELAREQLLRLPRSPGERGGETGNARRPQRTDGRAKPFEILVRRSEESHHHAEPGRRDKRTYRSKRSHKGGTDGRSWSLGRCHQEAFPSMPEANYREARTSYIVIPPPSAFGRWTDLRPIRRFRTPD